ncbi:MAG TPA: transglutaminase domain-containing protein [Flavobacterium sp.]|nr:transglutaminase domain-containing protein [Flavobacterium sp.]
MSLKSKVLLLMLFCFLVASAQDFSKVDAAVSGYPRSFSKPEELASKISRDFSGEEDKARAIFSWIAFNIRYDVESYFSNSAPKGVSYRYSTPEEKLQKERQLKLDKIGKVLRTNSALCHGYALLFEHLSSLCGLESVFISGNAKTAIGDIGRLPKESQHAWNAVRINGKWKLLDVTWAAGTVDPKKRTFAARFNDGYFFTPPEAFVLNHFPEDRSWTLGNFTEKEYAAYPLYYPEYFKSRFRILAPESGTIIIEKPKAVSFKIEGLDRNAQVFYALSPGDMPEKAVLRRAGGVAEFDVFINGGASCLTLYVSQKAVAAYKIVRKPAAA